MIGVPMGILLYNLDLPNPDHVRQWPAGVTPTVIEQTETFPQTVPLPMQLSRPFKVWWAYHEPSRTLHLSPATAADLMYTPQEMFRQATEIALSDLEPELAAETLKELDEVLEMDPDLALSLPLVEQKSKPIIWIMDAVQKHIVRLREGQVMPDWSAYRVSLGRGGFRGTSGHNLKSLLNAFKHALMHLREKSRA